MQRMLLAASCPGQIGVRVMNVFLVEDAVGIRRLIRASVEEAGGRVIGEAGGQSRAVSDIASLIPDVAIVDIRLEEGNGISVIQQVRKLQPTLVIIVLTWQERSHVESKCMDCGADYFFEKSAMEYPHFEALLKDLSARYVTTPCAYDELLNN